MVVGNDNAKYKVVGLVVCEDCISAEFDQRVGLWVSKESGPLDNPRDWTPPMYVGEGGVDGYAKLTRLDNGVYRLGLHRGHVEVWTKPDRDTISTCKRL